MSELRIYLRRGSLREGEEIPWVLRAPNGQIAAHGNALDELANHSSPRRCHLVLAAELVTCLPAQLPDLPATRLVPLLPAAAEAMSLSEAEQLHVALIDRDRRGTSWLAVIDRAWFTQTLSQLAARGLRIDAVLPESLLLPIEPSTWSVLAREDGGFARLGPGIGLALDLGDPPAALRLALTTPDIGGTPQGLRLYPGHALHPADPSRWQAALGCPVEVMPEWRWQDADWPSAPAGLNLLQGTLHPRHRRFEWQPLAQTLAWGALALATLQLAATGIDVVRLEREQERLRSELKHLAAQVLPAHATIVDPAWQIGSQLAALRAARGGGEDDALARLARVGVHVPAGGPPLRGLEHAEGRIVLRYASGPAAWSEAFLAALSDAGFTATTAPDTANGIRIVVEIRPTGGPDAR